VENKPFSQELYDKHDSAKFVMLAWANKHIGRSFINPDTYGPDIVSQVGFIEVEVCDTWTGKQWPYPTVHISARKRKWLGGKDVVWFAVLNKERTYAMILNGDAALEAPVISVNNRYAIGEMFMNIKTVSLIIDVSEFSDTITDTWEELRPSQTTEP